MTFRKRPEERDTLGSMSKPIEASIVVVDDEPSIRELLVASLHFAGFEVNTAASGSEAIEVIEKVQPDLIVLDVMLPDIDGFTVTRRIRQEGINAPVLFLTARDDTQDKIMGLTLGADDYITKPFGIMEFLSRVRAALRRAEPEARPNVYSFREILLDNARHSVTVSGAPVELTYKEYSLLRLLLENTNLVVTRETILQVVWGTDISVESRTVDMHIRTLRKKLGDAGKYICTVRKVGYKLTDSEEELEQ